MFLKRSLFLIRVLSHEDVDKFFNLGTRIGDT